ncbi:MerR family transcriptional regulator [Streptomyces caniscabiei]|uniref:MerR family transcriptional regulator n=1 Tax=Streptomyces caniscabiei TaxID=2746961 RepID=A0ABU4N0V3_9ACTN|nr:MerR family transcriptional regulator [Streptomyces caniscabiei]MBE4738682.1 MerR family transcriptional regulator [Streptomyces caniscabiei]MBE4756457.1 MerR family transcriptional regulator [Streptomyces caniscabiei]MBE4769038.1 MerR family transcriptional regulator [Streptomyces caniscabiei]MBE4782828.1 MerR family transcriptional regulator [Streptomyces caniscabiei]MBE4792131.1 MerR family transcriptional regulator [Streptomyces caniscabiei]
MTTDIGESSGSGSGSGSGSEEIVLTVDELAARAGVTVRTVRFYGTRGLLPPPEIGPRRVGHYGRDHLARLALIEELQRQGMTLAAIEGYLRRLPPGLTPRDLALQRAVVASWAPDAVATVTREELDRRAGRSLGEEDVERLVAMGVVERVGDGDGDGLRVDPGLLRLGVELLDVPLSEESIRAARAVLIEHSRAAAQALSRLFRDAVAERDPQAVKSLSAHMQPLVVQALLTTFQRSLKDELSRWAAES